ncbi:MAG: flagellar protein FlaG [Desulfobacteraceae bacterium]|nr:flagellar protein FlaG [Desulfobacteraceae bacterium]
MNINNINADVATMESPPVEAPAPQAASPAIDPVAKTEKVRMLQVKEEQKAGKANQGESLSAEETKQITEDLNEYMNDLQTNLRFSIYEKLDHQVVVEIKNRKTDELIKQIPSEEILELRVKMEELTGMLLDEKI